MKNRVFWSRFFLAASILTAIAIFCFSAQSGPDSAELSEGVTLTVARVVRPGFDELPAPEKLSFMDQLGLVVRKCAHFSEYALLGFLTHGLRSSLPRESLLPFGLSVVWAMLAPCLDETIQLFVPGRAGLVTDVLIDLGGVLVGTLLCQALLRRGRLKSI